MFVKLALFATKLDELIRRPSSVDGKAALAEAADIGP